MATLDNNCGTIFLLNFHGIGEPSHDVSNSEMQCWIGAQFFTAILDAIKERKDVELTFDDGNESDHRIALPLLKERNLTARFFVVANRIDNPGYLSGSQIRELCAAGMTIGNHGMRHQPWGRLGEAELDAELVIAREQLQHAVGHPVTEAACPFGVYNRHVLGKLRDSGYQTVYTSDNGPAEKDAWLQPRNTVLRSYNLERVKKLTSEFPSGLDGLMRNCKLALKRWR